MINSIYITDPQFEQILADLNIEGKTDPQKQELVDQAAGDMEADLVERFVVPLIEVSGGTYASAPMWARQKVLNILKEKIKQLIGRDLNRNLVVESGQRFIDLHKGAYDVGIKDMLDHKRMYGFKMHAHADNSVVPIQSMGLGRADNEFAVEDDPTI